MADNIDKNKIIDLTLLKEYDKLVAENEQKIQQSIDVVANAIPLTKGGAIGSDGKDYSIVQLNDSTEIESNIAAPNTITSIGLRGVALGFGSKVSGKDGLASGFNCHAQGERSHAEGYSTRASGKASHAEGQRTVVGSGKSAGHAEGRFTEVYGQSAHAEGDHTMAYGLNSHAEGYSARVLPNADVKSYTAEQFYALWLGYPDKPTTDTAYDGKFLLAKGNQSHAEGEKTLALGDASHAEGYQTVAKNKCSHAGGSNTIASADCQTVIGRFNIENPQALFIIGNGADVEDSNKAVRSNAFEVIDFGTESSVRIGDNNEVLNGNSFAIGAPGSATETGAIACSKGYYFKWIDLTNRIIYLTNNQQDFVKNTTIENITPNWAINDIISIVAPGNHYPFCGKITDVSQGKIAFDWEYDVDIAAFKTNAEKANGKEKGFDDLTVSVPAKPLNGNKVVSTMAFAEGRNVKAVGSYSHAEGRGSIAGGARAHAEGNNTKAGYIAHAEGDSCVSLFRSHAEGYKTYAEKQGGHAEGRETKAYGANSHAEGQKTEASGTDSHAEGNNTKAIGLKSHAEGSGTQAIGDSSHAGGIGTIANAKAQTAIGTYNSNNDNALFIIGNGTSSARRNAFEVISDENKNVSIKIGSTALTETRLKQLISGKNSANASYALQSEIQLLQTEVQNKFDKLSYDPAGAADQALEIANKYTDEEVAKASQSDQSYAYNVAQEVKNELEGKIAAKTDSTTVDALNQSLTNEIARAKTAEEQNAKAIERLTNGVSASEIDGVNDLINYVNTHGPEVKGIQDDIKNLKDNKADKSSLSNYALRAEVYTKNEVNSTFALQADFDALPSTELIKEICNTRVPALENNKADKTDIFNTNGEAKFTTTGWVTNYVSGQIATKANTSDLKDYALKSDIPSSIDAYTKTESDARYAKVNNVYSKVEADNLFATKALLIAQLSQMLPSPLASDVGKHFLLTAITQGNSYVWVPVEYTPPGDSPDTPTERIVFYIDTSTEIQQYTVPAFLSSDGPPTTWREAVEYFNSNGDTSFSIFDSEDLDMPVVLMLSYPPLCDDEEGLVYVNADDYIIDGHTYRFSTREI